MGLPVRIQINNEVCQRKAAMSDAFRQTLRDHIEFYKRNLHVTCAHVSPDIYPDRAQRSKVVDWLEQRVKSAIGRDRVMGRIGENLLQAGVDHGFLHVPVSLSYAFQKGKEAVIS